MAGKDYSGLPRTQQLAWAAGIIDGEGHIEGRIREVRPGHTTRTIRASVCQTHPEMLERLQDLFGGTIRKRQPPKNPKHSQRWDWKLTGYDKVSTMIEEVWPWLGSVKRAQGQAAMNTWLSSPRKAYNRKEKV